MASPARLGGVRTLWRKKIPHPDKDELWRGKPIKNMTVGLRKTGGRNNKGRLTVWTKGGGHKRKYRHIDFGRRVETATVEAIEYDPNRSARIARMINHRAGAGSSSSPSAAEEEEGSEEAAGGSAADGGSGGTTTKRRPVAVVNGIVEPERFYQLASADHVVGSVIESGSSAALKPGNALPLRFIPEGRVIHNIELYPGRGGQLVRAAGSSATLVRRVPKAGDNEKGGYAHVRLPSKEEVKVPLDCMATLGVVGHKEHRNRDIQKAGRSRWLGRRPKVRGVAMNPVDHPHGGGEGRTSGGRPSVTPWGMPTKGYPTRRNKSTDWRIVKPRPLSKMRGGGRGR